MTASQAKWIERAIIALCVISVLFIFQPFSIQLFAIGCVTVVIGALAFNIVPLLKPGVPAKAIYKAIVIILVILLIAAALGIGTAFLYVGYLESLR